MDIILVEFIIAVVLICITLVFLAKVVGEEISEDIYEYKRRNRWKKRGYLRGRRETGVEQRQEFGVRKQMKFSSLKCKS